MRTIKNQNLDQLLVQLKFTPEKKRLKQLDAAEKLFAIIKRDKEYPFEFVCFRITGFHPTSPGSDELIKGDVLLDDLQVFISQMSNWLARPAAEQNQKVYTVEELAKHLRISKKTIYRWRDRGLLAKKFVFNDGKKRLGFLQSTVDKFLKDNPDLLAGANNYSRLTDAQKQKIIKQAVRLTADTNLSRYQIINKISAEMGKCHETIRYILLEHEKANVEKSGSTYITGAIEPAQAAEIYRLYKQGCKVKELMKRYQRNRSSIYRIINQRRARALLAKKIEFVPSDDFLEQDAEKIIAENLDKSEQLAHKDVEPLELARGSLPEYLQTLKSVPVLNREHEVELFRRYNYLKFLACRSRTGIKQNRAPGLKINQIEKYLAQAEEIKKRIIEANLRLVVSIARKHMTGGANLLDLVGEGNISLMQAVEKFDYTRGFRFATFASWTIAKDFARKIPEQSTRLDKATTASIVSMHRGLKSEDSADFAAIERARQSLTQVIEDNLTEREQHVILNRFGLIGSPIKKETKTLKQIGEEFGLSKERVRQIELTALQKLRQSLSSEEFELLTS
ncbi:MAG: sigma-70 family RNA polymerase sigma factor [Planctomycetes bacterium]|nr:sigma-70 family RNA polymerase sigma factor [Planctomycetota bacterium]